jgi:hypothetical protein
MNDDTKPGPSTGSTSGPVYQVQARVKENWPAFNVGEMIVDQQWQTIRLEPSVWPAGVPTPRYAMRELEHGVPFNVAEAQRWVFICLVEVTRPASPIETRIVEFKLTRTWTCEEIGAVKSVPHWQAEHQIWNNETLIAK